MSRSIGRWVGFLRLPVETAHGGLHHPDVPNGQLVVPLATVQPPVPAEEPFLPLQFTVNALPQVYETVWDTRFDRGNSHRAVADARKGFLTAVEGEAVKVRRFEAQLFKRREGLEATGLLDHPVRRP